MESIIHIQNINGEDCITDENGDIILKNILDIEKIEREDDYVIVFKTIKGEYSYINSLGLFFDEYSYKEYDIVCMLSNYWSDVSCYKIRKNGKYGIVAVTSGECILDCVFDELDLLYNNKFSFNKERIIKVKKDNKFFGLMDKSGAIL